MTQRTAFALLLAFPVLNGGAGSAADTAFERDVLPILRQHCFACHSSDTSLPKAALRLDNAKAILRHVTPADPDASGLIDRVVRGPSDPERMPPDGPIPPLSPAEIDTVRRWVARGADFGGWTRASSARYQDFPAAPPKPVNVAAAAAEIDRLVEAKLSAAGRAPNPAADDATFLRRVSLDVAGRIPTLPEAEQFLADRSPDKRARLIDRLLESEGYVSRFFHLWADALRAKSDLGNAVSGDLYLWWIKDSLRRNQPYDRFVRQAVAAQGRYWDEPALGHFFRDRQNRLARVEATAAVFLGTEIGCAQCHNHPFDVWTRSDYHRFAAFFEVGPWWAPEGETFAHIPYKEVIRREQTLREEGTKKRDWGCRESDLAQMSWCALNTLKTRAARPKKHWPTLPADYQYPDAKAKQVIRPGALFGATRPAADNDANAMDVLADWVVSPKNPKFTLTVVNRLWDAVMGAPVAGELTGVLPIDDCRNPELVRFLTRVMIDAGYDRKLFLRVLLNSRTYQRAACSAALGPGEGSDFPGPQLRRMTAEQVWDSFLTLKLTDPDATIGKDRPDYSLYRSLAEAKTVDDYWAILERERNAGRGYVATFGKNLDRKRKVREAGFLPDDLKRASELPSPAPDGHLLRLFGQSDRETTDAAWANPTIPQALALMNGPLLDVVLADDSALGTAARASGSPRAQVRVVFLALLAREPSPGETDAVLARLGGDGPDLWRSLTWTLLNTRRFLFVQ
jgi:mono/diheme cytochrome c family protein